jgi:hypothetical protein
MNALYASLPGVPVPVVTDSPLYTAPSNPDLLVAAGCIGVDTAQPASSKAVRPTAIRIPLAICRSLDSLILGAEYLSRSVLEAFTADQGALL